jgi:aspartate/methionine/tyrosine aminotransferase
MINDYFATLALENADQLLARSQRITRENLAVLDTWIQNESRVSWVKPRAGTTAMLKLDIPISSREFCIDLAQKTGVMLTPGDAFDMEGYARIGFANELETIEVGSAKAFRLFTNNVLKKRCPNGLNGVLWVRR